VLHYFNDQLLVNEAQLQTLVRQAGVGTEVTLKLLRKGIEQSVVVKLGEHEQREVADARPWQGREPRDRRPGFFSHPTPDTWMFDMNSDNFADKVRDLTERLKNLDGKSADRIREEVERFQKEIQEEAGKAADSATKQADTLKDNTPSRGKAKVWKDDKGGIHVELRAHDDHADAPGSVGVTATADDKGTVTVTQTSNTRMTWNDGDGSGELLIEDGKKNLTAKDRDGKEVFSGPVDTEEQLKSLPDGLRERLERLESKVKVEVRPGKPAGDH
jgi:hypothetical protein